jgi:hypothetical protein
MDYDSRDYQIGRLKSRVKDLEEQLASLRNEIKNKIIEKNLYNTSSIISEDTIHEEWEYDYGQQRTD